MRRLRRIEFEVIDRERCMKEMGKMEEEIERARMSYRGRGGVRGIE